MQVQKEGSGDLMSHSGMQHHSVPTRQLSHTVREKNQEAVQVSHIRADILHSPPHAHMFHSKTPTTQCVSPAPTPLPVKTLQGLTSRIHESSGHTHQSSGMMKVNCLGENKTRMWSESTGKKLEKER